MPKQPLNTDYVFDTIVESIKEILRNARSGENVDQGITFTMETNILEEVGLDSVEMLDLLSLLEAKLKVSLAPEKIGLKATIKEVVDYILKNNGA